MKRGPYGKRQTQFERAVLLRREGLGYREIAKNVAVPWKTVANWCKGIPCDRAVAYRFALKRRRDRINATPTEQMRSKGAIRNWLIRKRGHACEGCSLTKWRGLPIMLETEHMDGDNKNNAESNLLLLCPNCHAQTATWRRKGARECANGIADRFKNDCLEVQILPRAPITGG